MVRLDFLLKLTRRGLFKEKTGGPAVTAEFLRDAVGNFVLQSLMKRLWSEFTWSLKRSAFQITASTSAEDLMAAAKLVSVWYLCGA